MKPWPPAVMVHGVGEAARVMGHGLPVTLLSAPWAAAYAGCLWWREVVQAAMLARPGTECRDILDCGDLAGRALEALRMGQPALVLRLSCPAYASIAERSAALGATLFASPPPSLDMAGRGAERRLAGWLAAR